MALVGSDPTLAGAAREAVRERIPGLGPDRRLAPELAAADELVRSGALLDAVQRAIGALA